MSKRRSLLRAFGGHAVDLWNVFQFEPSNPRSMSKMRQIRAVARRTGSTTFIETGTRYGHTALAASKYFDRVITIEIVEELYEKAKAYTAKRKNIECLLGDCSKLLPEVLNRADLKNVLVYLDGHFSGGDTGMADVPEPAIEEIDTISAQKSKINGVVIDDFRTFTGTDDMPSKADLLFAIEKRLPEYDVKVHMDQVLIERLPETR